MFCLINSVVLIVFCFLNINLVINAPLTQDNHEIVEHTNAIVQDLTNAMNKFNSLYENGQDIAIEYYTPIYSRNWQLDTKYQTEIQDSSSQLIGAGNDFHTTLVDGGSNDDTDDVNDKLQAIYLSIAKVKGQIDIILTNWYSKTAMRFRDQLHTLAANNTLPSKQLSKQLANKAKVAGQSILNNLLADKLALEESVTVIGLQLSFIKHGQQMKDLLSEAKDKLTKDIDSLDPYIKGVVDVIDSQLSGVTGGQLAG